MQGAYYLDDLLEITVFSVFAEILKKIGENERSDKAFICYHGKIGLAQDLAE